MLKVKKLVEHAILPTVAYPGEDLGFDLYAAESATLLFGTKVNVGTGIAAQVQSIAFMTSWGEQYHKRFGLLIRDRGSMAAKGIMVSAGVVDASYTGEIRVFLTMTSGQGIVYIKKGDKIAQMIPIEVMTQFPVVEVEDLDGNRGTNGFGSSGA